MHTEPEKAAAGLFGGIIASGWQIAVLSMRLFVDCRIVVFPSVRALPPDFRSSSVILSSLGCEN